MESSMANQEAERSRLRETAYREGYHHGLSHAFGLLLGLLESGLPRSAGADLCQVFEQQIVIFVPFFPLSLPQAQSSPNFSR
jgi:hypothetical protein